VITIKKDNINMIPSLFLYQLRNYFLQFLIFSLFASLPLLAQAKVEFEVGRTPPTKNNLPSLGSGLAMSKGYYRGSPLGELSGWTLSLWFEAKSDKKGDLFGIVRNENNGEAYRLTYENGTLSFGDPKQKNRPWKLMVKGVEKEKWNHLVISYAQATGPAIYLI